MSERGAWSTTRQFIKSERARSQHPQGTFTIIALSYIFERYFVEYISMQTLWSDSFASSSIQQTTPLISCERKRECVAREPYTKEEKWSDVSCDLCFSRHPIPAKTTSCASEIFIFLRAACSNINLDANDAAFFALSLCMHESALIIHPQSASRRNSPRKKQVLSWRTPNPNLTMPI